jgi:hypothetical protein
MQGEPSIQALSVDANIYALRDERGNTLGTGTREVCEVLLYIMTKARANPIKLPTGTVTLRSNVRAAIPI